VKKRSARDVAAPAPATASPSAAAVEEDDAIESEPPAIERVPTFFRGNPPPIAAMRKAGYLGDERELKAVWGWVRDQGDGAVWPTPIAGAQEAVRFDACGWPNENSTPEEWVPLLTFWTALREQLVGGASRAQRRSASSQLAQYGHA